METLLEYSEEAMLVVAGLAGIVCLSNLWYHLDKMIKAHRESRDHKLRANRDYHGERRGRYSDSNGLDPDDE